MRKIALLLLFVTVNGCAILKTGDGQSTEPDQSAGHAQSSETASSVTAARTTIPSPLATLAQATALLDAGDRRGAIHAFTAICDSSGVPGVTDEALYQLALLSLHPVTDKEGNAQGLQLLKRLKKEYPASRWTERSGPLVELLVSSEELRRQNKNLKIQNQSLNNEVSELHRNIKKLKRLDQELEKERRR